MPTSTLEKPRPADGRRLAGIVFALILAAGWTTARAQEQTVGLFVHEDGAFEGYTLLTPLRHNSTYLIDNDGQMVHAWTHEKSPSGATYLLPNGSLLRGSLTLNPALNFGGLGGRVQEVTWDGDVAWEFIYSDSLHALHHDVARLPNGNVLMIAWEYHSADDAIASGRDPALLPSGAFWPEQVIEVKPTPPLGGDIVWIWRVWDHLIQDFDDTKANFGVVEDHPERVDINYASARQSDWLHANAINYNATLDQIILSIPGFDELWVIDHSTTTEEAAGSTGGNSGKGGDLLYRWGNPEAYRAGTSDDRQFQFVHDIHWIEPGLPGAGHVLAFDNGLNRRASAVVELALPVDENGDYGKEADGFFSPAEIVWRYDDPGTFFSGFASGEQRMPNGNTLIAEAETGRIFEVTPDKDIVWQYVNPVTDEGPLAQGDSIPPFSDTTPWLANSVFRAYRYAPDYAGLAGKDLSPKGLIELMPTAAEEDGVLPEGPALLQNYPNPFNPATTLSFRLSRPGHVTLAIYNTLGQRVATVADRRYGPGTHTLPFDAAGLPGGVYLYRLDADGHIATKTMVLVK